MTDRPDPRPTAVPHQRPDPAAQRAVVRCGYCGRELTRHREEYAVLADSSYLHPTDATMDGHRVVAVCSDEHLDLLRAATPRFVEEQLWALQLDRATDHHRSGPLAAHARRAGLTTAQANRAVLWRRNHRTPGHTNESRGSSPGSSRHA